MVVNPKSLTHPPLIISFQFQLTPHASCPHPNPQSLCHSRSHTQEHVWVRIGGFCLLPFRSLDQFLNSHHLGYVIFFFGCFSLICLLSRSQEWVLFFLVFISLFGMMSSFSQVERFLIMHPLTSNFIRTIKLKYLDINIYTLHYKN